MTREASSEAMRRIGLSLKSWRAMGGVTADELAEAIGVSRDTLSRVERGDSSVGVGTVLDVCGEFGLLDKVMGAVDPANSEVGKIGLLHGVPKRVRKAQPTVAQDWRTSMNWYDGSFVYQIYPLGLCGAPWANDGSSEGATNEDEHRLLKIVNDGWVDHVSKLGSNCVIANGVQLAGHVVVEDWATFGGLSAVAQHLRIGESAFVAGGAKCERSVPPFVIVQGDRARVRALNVVGLRRRGLGPDAMARLKEAFKEVFVRKHRIDTTWKMDADPFLAKFATALEHYFGGPSGNAD